MFSQQDISDGFGMPEKLFLSKIKNIFELHKNIFELHILDFVSNK